MKGTKDWHQTKNAAQRIKYIETVLCVPTLQGCVFHACHRSNRKNYWGLTIESLELAIRRFSEGMHTNLIHQGFKSGTRDKLQKDLRARGLDVDVLPGNQSFRPEIRLADGLCGYLGILEAKTATANAYPTAPDWFLDLKKETLPQKL